MKKATIFAIFALVCSIGFARSQNLLVNGSFELGLSMWNASGAVEARGDRGFTDGSAAAVFGFGNVLPSGALTQSFATIPGQQYELQFDYGIFGTGDPFQGALRVQVGSSSLDVLLTGIPPGMPPSFHTLSLLFTPTSSLSTLSFRDLSQSSQTIDFVLDRASVRAVPEPSLISLLFLGSALLVWRAWRLTRRCSEPLAAPRSSFP